VRKAAIFIIIYRHFWQSSLKTVARLPYIYHVRCVCIINLLMFIFSFWRAENAIFTSFHLSKECRYWKILDVWVLVFELWSEILTNPHFHNVISTNILIGILGLFFNDKNKYAHSSSQYLRKRQFCSYFPWLNYLHFVDLKMRFLHNAAIAYRFYIVQIIRCFEVCIRGEMWNICKALNFSFSSTKIFIGIIGFYI